MLIDTVLPADDLMVATDGTTAYWSKVAIANELEHLAELLKAKTPISIVFGPTAPRPPLIRNFAISDWEALCEMICQYESSHVAVYDQPWPTSPEEIKAITEWFASGDSYLAVCLKNTGRFSGFVALHQEQQEDKPVFNLGYIFHSGYHGRGYATEAWRAVLDHAFDRLHAQRLVKA